MNKIVSVKKVLRVIILSIIVLSCSSCLTMLMMMATSSDNNEKEMQDDYEKTINANRISSEKIYMYEQFLDKYPESIYIEDVTERINILVLQEEEDKMWKDAWTENSTLMYKSFILKYPESSRVEEANGLIEKLKPIEEWKSSSNYTDLVNQFPVGFLDSTIVEEGQVGYYRDHSIRKLLLKKPFEVEVERDINGNKVEKTSKIGEVTVKDDVVSFTLFETENNKVTKKTTYIFIYEGGDTTDFLGVIGYDNNKKTEYMDIQSKDLFLLGLNMKYQ